MAAPAKVLPAAILLATLAAPAEASLGPAFEKAATVAARKLGDASCLILLSDFHDASGRPLAERLSAMGLAARELFERLDFRSGARETACQRTRVDAFTHVGGGTIFVCPDGCFAFGRRDVGHASNVLIHEMLHALGLGEDPPTSLEITGRVTERCGR